MNCPNCRVTMRLNSDQPPKYVCGNCGMKKAATSATEFGGHVERPKRGFDIIEDLESPAPPSPPPEKTQFSVTSGEAADEPMERPEPIEKKEPSKRREKREVTTPSRKREKRVDTQKLIDLRKAAQELQQRVSDLEVQFSRRLEELEILAKRLVETLQRFHE